MGSTATSSTSPLRWWLGYKSILCVSEAALNLTDYDRVRVSDVESLLQNIGYEYL